MHFVRKGASEALTAERAARYGREIEPPSRKRWPLWGADAVELSWLSLSTSGSGSARGAADSNVAQSWGAGGWALIKISAYFSLDLALCALIES
jgi:hypothetical protein